MSSPATLERPDAPKSGKAPPADAAPGCAKCGNLESWGATSWCPKCGYYPRLGTSVVTDDPASQADTAPPPTSYVDALRRLPRWAWVLAAGVMAIVLLSIAIRAITDADGDVRGAWALLQLLVGGGTFAVVHVYAFFKSGAKGTGLSGFDVVVRPIEVWRRSFQELPATARRIWVGGWGYTAALCAVFVIGGIRYSALTDDWGFRQRPKSNLLKQIKEQAMANAKEGADNLEDAIGDFAGDDDPNKKKNNKKKKEETDLDLLSAECVVVGYNLDLKTGLIRELVLASVIDGKLQFAGIVDGNISHENQVQLQQKLPALQQEQSFLKCPVKATWVKPVISCSTSFKQWTKSKRMDKPVLKELLADVKLK